MTPEQVVPSYIECALWSSIDPDHEGECLDALYSADDLSDELRATVNQEVSDFLFACHREGIDLDALEPEQAGHDLWLTRNHHGAGFWDRGLGELGDRLTALAHAAGEVTWYPGDDGRIYQ